MGDSTAADEIGEQQPLLHGGGGSGKGGIRTLPFIIANEGFESCADNGLLPNMSGYLIGEYGLSAVQSSNVLYLWTSFRGCTPVFAAFLADSYLGRYRMIAFGSVFTFLGMSLLWLTAAIPEARPCSGKSTTHHCSSPTGLQLFALYFSFFIISIGTAGIQSSCLAFGGDQLTINKTNKNSGLLESFMSWYYASTLLGTLFGMTVIVYIQDNIGWNIGYGICAVLMFLSMLSFFLASSSYVKHPPSSSFFTSLFQVAVASYRKRHVRLPSESSCGLYHHGIASTPREPSDKLRFLNKACIVMNPEEDVLSDPWSVCTVEQVENLKSIINIIPIWSTGILFSASFNQMTLPYIQVSSMDRHITSNFQIPTGSFSMFLFISIGLWIFLYDRVFIPLASKINKKPTRLNPLHKIGLGIFMTFLSMASLGVIEIKRRDMAVEDDVKMSAFWLLPHYIFAGIGVACCMIGQNEFYYSELPKSMSSIATSLSVLSMSAGGMVGSFVLTSMDNLTKDDRGVSWVSTNINEAHYDYYFFLISCLSLVDFLYFVVCCKKYGRCKGEEDDLNCKISKDQMGIPVVGL